jgi:hypothetical protein
MTGQKLYTPAQRERKRQPLLTVDQYVRKAKQDRAISDLILVTHKSKIMTFEEWEREVSNLLKKKTW